MCSKKNGTLYVGVTNDLKRRIFEHKNNLVPGFTTKYHIHYLVYYETYQSIYDAINREKQIKKWGRSWKLRLIEQANRNWNDLYEHI
jgi:putative endonuclease